MKIAIIAPSPTPFTIGGAEKLWQSLYNYINKHTNNQCELIKIPIKENSFWNLIDAYYTFYKLDLSHFDMIISGKYPAWMINHPNHHLYMLHPLRGLYDQYNTNLEYLKTDNTNILKLRNSIKENQELEYFFKLLYDLKNDKTIKDEFFSFPSSFLKEIIHFLDKKAFENIKSFSAISKTVANRKDYFLTNSKVKVLYPPSNFKNYKNSSYSYFFTASRLHEAKRIDLIIKAYQESNCNIPLKIAGIGPQEEELKTLISNNPQIELLGHISDNELLDYYANAYAVIFIPKEEDYGYITIEAMNCEKPVITMEDSGGVLEFVEDNITGLIAKSNIQDLSQKIAYLSKNKDITISLGKNAKEKVKNISWQNVTSNLFKVPIKLIVITTYPIYPPQGGGQNRIFYLYKELSKTFDITIVSLVHSSLQLSKKEIAPNLYEIQVPKSELHEETESQMSKKANLCITDIAMLSIFDLTQQFIQIIKEEAKTSKFIISPSPYTYPLLKKYTNTPIIYESQNVEYILKKQMLEKSEYNEKLLTELYKVEKELIQNSLFTTVCAPEDKDNFTKLYDISLDMPFIANGVDLETVEFFSKKRKNFQKRKLKFNDKKTAIFIGSAHGPNIDAVDEIIKMAKIKDDFIFLIVGGVCTAFQNKELPKNILLKGFVNDDKKNQLLSISNIALNPMKTGSGSNLKMLDYLASGIPIITTKIGARGLNLPSKILIYAKPKEFIKYFDNIDYYTDAKKGKNYVIKHFDWKSIANNLKIELQQNIND